MEEVEEEEIEEEEGGGGGKMEEDFICSWNARMEYSTNGWYSGGISWLM